MHKSVACLRLKPNWLSLVTRKVSNSFDKHNSNNLDIAVTIIMNIIAHQVELSRLALLSIHSICKVI